MEGTDDEPVIVGGLRISALTGGAEISLGLPLLRTIRSGAAAHGAGEPLTEVGGLAKAEGEGDGFDWFG
jgi:hypothetical protein